jgi:AbrB family looped-hinge helix DNA binding protein
VPLEVRERLGLRPGTPVEFELREEGVLLRKRGEFFVQQFHMHIESERWHRSVNQHHQKSWMRCKPLLRCPKN